MRTGSQRAEVTIEVGDEEWLIGEGDGCSVDSRVPHRYVNRTNRPCRFMLAVTPPSF